MGFVIKNWRWFAGGAIAALLIGAFLGFGWYRYHTGYKDATTKIQAENAEAVRQQTQTVIEKERQAQAQLASAQAQLEKEREHAKTTIADLRTELGRVRQTADAHRRALSQTATAAGTPDGQDAARGWQLFGYCSERLSGLAEVADEQRNDLAEWQAYGRVVAGQVDK